MGKTTGFLEYARREDPRRSPAERVRDWEEFHIALPDAVREQQVQGEVLPNPDGTCTVRLRLADDSGPLLELSLLMPAAGQGERAAARFKQAPEQLYHQLVQLLSVPEEREETP